MKASSLLLWRPMLSRWLPLAAVLVLVGCDHPTEADCRKAVENIDHLTGGGDATDRGRDTEEAVRSCRSRSSTAAVRCIIAAKSVEDLAACEAKGKSAR